MTFGPHCRSLLAAFSLAALPLASAPAGAKALETTVAIDHPVVAAGARQPVYLLVKFRVPEDDTPLPPADRPGLNLALVLDRSGSMADAGKLTYLKRAAKAIVQRMSARDRLAVVEYDDRVTIAWPSAPVETPELIGRVIDELSPRGATDLVAGMMAGVAQVEERYRPASVNRVLLLSDGLANRGVTSRREIRRLVRQARAHGVPITTLGLGLEYDEDLMQAIAENSGGAYYYIESPTQIAGIFQRELGALMRTAARDVDLGFRPGPLVRSVEVLGYETQDLEGATTVDLPDFFAGEERSLVLRLELAGPVTEGTPLGTLSLAYENVADGTRRQDRRELALSVSDDAEAVRKAANRDAIVEAALVEAELAHGDSLALLDAGKWQEAEKKLGGLVVELKRRNAQIDDVRLAKKIEALEIEGSKVQAVAAAPAAASSQSYVKRSKQRLYEAKKGARGLYMLQAGDSGDEVARLQQALQAAGRYAGPLDGQYSAELESAIRDYQSEQRLAVDGIAGPATLNALGLY